MSARELITEHRDLWTGAVTKKSSSGRGGNGKVELTGVKRLRELILQLAVTGRLVEQDASEEPATELIKRIQAGKEQLSLSSKQRKAKPLPPISESERPFPLPPGWVLSRLDDITDIQGGIAKGKKVAGRRTRILPYLRVANVQRSSLDLSEIKEIEIAEEEIERYLVRQGDLLITEGGDWDKVGRTAIWDGRLEPMAHQNHVFRARLILREQNERWLERYLNSRFARDYFAGSSKQTTNLASINKTQLRSCTVPLPPLEEQHRIVQKVDELMALCDRLEQQTSDQLEAHETLVDTLLDTLTQSENATDLAENWARLAAHFDTLFTTEQSIDKLKQTILQLAVMGRLVEQDVGDESGANLLTQIYTRKTALADDKKIKRPRPLTQLDDIQHSYPAPAHWAWASFEDIADEISTGPFGSMIHKHDYVENGIPLVNPSHMANGEIKEDSSVSVTTAKAEELSSYKVANGDIVMARRGEVGRCAIVTDRESGWICGTGSFVLRFHPAINRRFILLLFSTNTVREYLSGNSVGTTMTNLNHGILKKMPVALPPAKEQHRIVQKVDELTALCDQLKERLNQASETRNQLAEAVVQGALN